MARWNYQRETLELTVKQTKQDPSFANCGLDERKATLWSNNIIEIVQKKCFDQDGKQKKTSRKHKITPWFSQNMGLKPRRFNQKTGTYSAGGNHQQNMGFKQQKLSFNQNNDGNWVFWTFGSWSCSKYDMTDTDVLWRFKPIDFNGKR